MARKLQKFTLLLWKNWLLQWRHKIQTLIEILAPVVLSMLLVVVRSLVDPVEYKSPQTYDAMLPYGFPNTNTIEMPDAPINWNLAWSPENAIFKDVMDSVVASTVPLPVNITQKPFSNAANLLAYLAHPTDENMDRTIAGVVFPDSLATATELPKNLQFSLRFPGELRASVANPVTNNWRTSLLFPILQFGPREMRDPTGGNSPGYFSEGFLALQHQISKVLIAKQAKVNEYTLPTIYFQRYPYPPFISDPLLIALEAFVSIFIMLSFVYTCINTVKVITNEKEKQLKEAMKIMGLPGWLHWTAWFTKTLSFLLISVLFIVLLFKVRWYEGTDLAVFTNTDGVVMFLFLTLYMIASICFCFMISVFFSKANTAAAVAGLVWFFSYAPYLFLQESYDTLSVAAKMVACLASNSAMGYGFKLMLMHEGTGEGLQWHNIFTPVTPDDGFHMGLVLIMLIVDAIIYMIVTVYVEQIFPGEYGVAQPWYYPFTPSYWGCGSPAYRGVEDIANNNTEVLNEDIVVEANPVGLHKGVAIKGLRKVYSGTGKVAVEGLNLDMFEDQITVLLGHNGAGKTTTMSMLTGMFQPTSGTATVNGYDIRTNINGVRDSLGLCPQHNVLFGELTVREHLYFFSKLKGLSGKDIEAEVVRYINLLELVPKANSPSSTLSGGMQRKLSVAVALCGGSKVVLCDEPTSGMDPAARRALWDLLQAEKKGRTLLLSTHFMDEADLLGDRIAIMAAGKLQCVGSSFFLKKKFGDGYHLIIVKDDNCDVNAVTNLLKKYIPSIEIANNIGSELSYILNEAYVSSFEMMFNDLENHSQELKLLSYGVSLTTLEEVFMKVGSDKSGDAAAQAISNGLANGNSSNGHLTEDVQIFKENGDYDLHNSETKLDITEQSSLLSGTALVMNQIIAMFTKKFLVTYRGWVLFIIQNIIPVSFLIITIIVVRAWGGAENMPPMKFSLEPYGTTTTVMSSKGEIDPASPIGKMAAEYEAMMKKITGSTLTNIGTSDMQNFILNKSMSILPTVSMTYIVGATFDATRLTAWFNNQPYHALPLSMNMMHNAVLKGLVGSDYSIEVTNDPLPFRPETRFSMLATGNNMGFQLAFNIGFGMAFVSSFYVLFYIKERVSKAKLLQFVSGVEVLSFWVTAFIWDFLTFLITSILLTGTMAAFQEMGFATPAELGRVFSVLICFGFSMLPLMYLSSFLFDIPSTGFVRMTLINIFLGVAAFMVVEILKTEGLDLEDVAKILDWIFLLYPHYTLCTAFRNLNTVAFTKQVCYELLCELVGNCDPVTQCALRPECCFAEEPYYSWELPGIGRNMAYFLLVGAGLFIFLLLIEYKIIARCFYVIKSVILFLKRKIRSSCCKDVERVHEEEFVDSDVQVEKDLVHSFTATQINQHNLVLNDMTKYYDNFLAVNKLCVSVKRAECFGLLGVNGAGKTSTFKMLTGDELISGGDAWVCGLSLKTSMKQVHQLIGYCPQFDALIDNLTGRETLMMFCLLRGVARSDAPYITNKLAQQLNFNQHIDKKVNEYSGGNKRKLSTAVSLIGDPPVVYLDEPTTGMDPAAKRHLWNAVCNVRDKGRTIVLTSHSMEECEALCTRLAVMVNGEFKCIGSQQHLKNKFSDGFTLTIKVRKNDATRSEGITPQTRPSTQDHNGGIVNGLFGEVPTETTVTYEERIQNVDSKKLDAVKKFVQESFPTAILKEEYQCLLTYYIPTANPRLSNPSNGIISTIQPVPTDTDVTWSKMFGIMERGKHSLEIEDYSLGQTTLEQVFLSFTKKQRTDADVKKAKKNQ